MAVHHPEGVFFCLHIRLLPDDSAEASHPLDEGELIIGDPFFILTRQNEFMGPFYSVVYKDLDRPTSLGLNFLSTWFEIFC